MAKGMRARYANLDLHLAFVRYTDYDLPESQRTSYFGFSRNIGAFEKFVGDITADGGRDAPEDVFGGLYHALRLSWGKSTNTNILIHIADAPCHGNKYHTLEDDYPKGDPSRIPLSYLMESVIGLRLQYWFGRITVHTDLMIRIFNNEIERQDAQFPKISTFAALDNAVGMAKSVTSVAVESITATMSSLSLKSPVALRPYKIDTTSY